MLLLILQIAMVVGLTRSFARAARAKGRSGAWAAFTVALCVAGELAGLSLSVEQANPNASAVFGLMGMMGGAVLSWLVISLLPARAPTESPPRSARTPDPKNPYNPPQSD